MGITCDSYRVGLNPNWLWRFLTSFSISTCAPCGLHLSMLGLLLHFHILGHPLFGRILRRRPRGLPSQPYFFLEYLMGIHLPINFSEIKYHLAIHFPLHPHLKLHIPTPNPRFIYLLNTTIQHFNLYLVSHRLIRLRCLTTTLWDLFWHGSQISYLPNHWASSANTETSWPAPAPMVPPQVPQHPQPQAPPTSTSAPPPSPSPAPPTSPSRPPATPKRAASYPSRHRMETNLTKTLKNYLNQIQAVAQSSLQPAPTPQLPTPEPPPTDPPPPPATRPRPHRSRSNRHSTPLPRLRHPRRSRSRSPRHSRHHSHHRRSPFRPPRTPSRHRRRSLSPRHSTSRRDRSQNSKSQTSPHT